MPDNQYIIAACQILVEKGYAKSLAAIAKELGKTAQYFTDLKKGKASYSREFLDALVENYPVNRNYILTGEGQVLRSPTNEAVVIEHPNIKQVPLISKYAYAGYLRGYGDQEYVDALPTLPFILPDEQTARGEYVAIEVKGDSMDNGTDESLKDGDILLCRRIHQSLWTSYKLHIRKWNFVIMCNEGILVKRIVDHNIAEHTITIHSLNELYQDEVVNLTEVREIFNVVQMMRKPVL